MSVANPAAANAALDELGSPREADVDEALSRQEAMATKRRLEQCQEQDQEHVMVPVGDEEIPMKPIPPGRMIDIARRAVEAERSGNREDEIVVADDMIQEFVDRSVHADIFDREFFDTFDRSELRTAWTAWGQRSNGGSDAGN